MPTLKPQYPAQFHDQAVELVRAGRKPGELNRGPEGVEGQQAFLEKRKPCWPSLQPTSEQTQ